MREMQPWIKDKLNSLLTRMETVVHVPLIMAHGCCRPEIENVSASTYDWSRLGVTKDVQSPEEADLLIVAGWINAKAADEIKAVYAGLSGRKSVIAVGTCALSGGPYLMSGEKPILASDILPVDVFVPGCPPRPEALIEAVRVLKERMTPRPDHNQVLYQALKDQRM